jgi:hypothetical protein
VRFAALTTSAAEPVKYLVVWFCASVLCSALPDVPMRKEKREA